jgi:hypothetical protein
VTWTTNGPTRIVHTNLHYGAASGTYTTTTAERYATSAGARTWSATIVAPQAGTLFIVVHAREASGAETATAEVRCAVVTVTTPPTPTIPTTPTAGAFEGPAARLHADVDRNGQVNAADDAGRDQWTTSRGVVLAYNNDDDDGDLRLDCDDSIVNGPNDPRTMTRVVVARLTSAATSVDLAFSPGNAPSASSAAPAAAGRSCSRPAGRRSR